MKTLNIVLILLIPQISKSQTSQTNSSNTGNIHFSLNAKGGDISSPINGVSYTIGQISCLSQNSHKYFVTEGILQPPIIFIRPIDLNEENSFKVAAYPNPVTDFYTIETSRAPP